MDTKKYLKFAGLISFCAVIVMACNSNQTSKTETTNNSETTEVDKENLKSEVSDVVYPLPSPFELTNMLNDIGARFELDVLNNVGNVDKYITEKDKALNLGVYGADLSYSVTYDKKQETNLYLKATKTLLDELSITIDFGYLFEDSAKGAVQDKDSLVNLITQVYYDTYTFLQDKSSASLSALMTTGFFIEGLYIATHISDYTYDNTEIVKLIFGQKMSVNKLIELLEGYSDDEFINEIINDLTTIKAAYGENETSLTRKQLDTIKATIGKVRAEIVE